MGQSIPPHIDICVNCRNYKGLHFINLSKDIEDDYVNFCKAFSDEIPNEILIGDNKHTKPLKDQKNDIVFEPIK